MRRPPHFFYFQSGALTLYLVIYSNICDRRHFLGEKIETIDNGYQMKSHAAGWYYKPFWPNLPNTSDWWAMDNPNTRERVQGAPLDTKVSVTDTGDGVDVAIDTDGIDRLPFLPGGWRAALHSTGRAVPDGRQGGPEHHADERRRGVVHPCGRCDYPFSGFL